MIGLWEWQEQEGIKCTDGIVTAAVAVMMLKAVRAERRVGFMMKSGRLFE